jgi:prophage regulatory protein
MFLKLKDVQKITGLSRSSIYAYIDKGLFPIQVKLGQRSVAWLDTEIESWVDGKINARNASNDENYINKMGDKNERV